MKRVVAVAVALAATNIVSAADIEAGKAKVQTVCAACHGAAGVSVSDAIPNLASQKASYIESQLRALKEGSRKNAIMNSIASQLSDDDIRNVAAYFASQPGATPGAKSPLLASVAKSNVPFPEGYSATFTRYHTVNSPEKKQVSYFYANPVAIQAARDGKPLPDGSVLLIELYAAKLDAHGAPVVGDRGALVPDKLTNYGVMARQAGWGRDIPDMLRNEDWNYAAFAPDKQMRTTVNQAECLGCHKPVDKTSYVYTFDRLAAAAKAR